MSINVVGRTIAADPRAVWGALRLEVAAQPRVLRWWLGFLILLVAIGAVAAVLALPPGDEVLGTSAAFEWGLLISGYVLFVVTTSGLCLVSSLGHVFGVAAFKPVARRAAVLAVLVLMAGFGIIALDLHYPLRLVFGVVLSPSPMSPMWWMGVVYAAYLVFLLLELLGMFAHRDRVTRVGASLALVAAIVAPSTLGAVFGVLVARPWWHGGLTPLYLLLTAFLSGTALLGLVFSLVNHLHLRGQGERTERAAAAIGRLLMLLLGIVIVVVGWQTVIGLYGAVPGLVDATMAQLVGPLALQFWIVKVLVGLIVPFGILAYRRTRTPRGILVASGLVIVGLVADRIGFVSAGQIAPATAASGIVSDPWAIYSPTFVEIGIVVGAAAAVALAYTLAERYLDLDEPSHEVVLRTIAPAVAVVPVGVVAVQVRNPPGEARIRLVPAPTPASAPAEPTATVEPAQVSGGADADEASGSRTSSMTAMVDDAPATVVEDSTDASAPDFGPVVPVEGGAR